MLSRDLPIGLRDCACEVWTFEGTITPATTARSLEWWVGTSADACRTAINRFPANNATCWPLESLGNNRILPIASNRFSIAIPARWLIDPIAGTCTPPPQVSAGSSVHLTGLLRPPDDAVPSGSVPVTVSVMRPRVVEVVTASGAESSAIVQWQHIRTEDGGTAQVPDNTTGYYILCLPRVVTADAGTSSAACGSSTTDAGMTDVGTVDASDSGDDAGLSDVVTTMDASTEPTSCASAVFPTNFEPNDDTQLNQYACSPLLPTGSNRRTITGLANGQSYRFAVVAQDNAGNRSVVSSLTPCVSPEEVTDFWEHYQRTTGMNGAAVGACSAAPVGAVSGLGATVAGLLLASLSALRARRRAP